MPIGRRCSVQQDVLSIQSIVASITSAADMQAPYAGTHCLWCVGGQQLLGEVGRPIGKLRCLYVGFLFASLAVHTALTAFGV
jgi:hypothetical protein